MDGPEFWDQLFEALEQEPNDSKAYRFVMELMLRRVRFLSQL